MNLIGYLEPIKNELNLVLKEEGYENIEAWFEERNDVDLTNIEKIAYHVGQINLIGAMLSQLAVENPSWGEEE